MQFSEHLVFQNFDQAALNRCFGCKKLDFSNYSKRNTEAFLITKALNNESGINSEVCSFLETTPKKPHKKFSFENNQTGQKPTQSHFDLRPEATISRTTSTLSGDHNSYFSCMANLEIPRAEEFEGLEFTVDASDKDKETLRLNYETLKKQFITKAGSPMRIGRTKKAKAKDPSDSKRNAKHYERKEFTRLSQQEIMENFEAKIERRSQMSNKLYDLMASSPTLTRTPKSRKIKVFCFGQPTPLELNIGKRDTVMSLLERIIQKYMNLSWTDKKLLKFPSIPTAYELRYLDEDDGCKPDLTLEPLDESQPIYEYFLDSVAFDIKQAILCQTKENISVIDEIIEKHQVTIPENTISLEVTFKKENFSTLVVIENDKNIVDIFKEIKIKNKAIKPKNYKIFEDFEDLEGMEHEGPRELDFNMPIKNLISKKLQLVERKFADDPMQRSTMRFKARNDSVYASEALCGANNLSKILLNEILACKPEDFSLIQIPKNEKKSKKHKLVSIDQIKLSLAAAKNDDSAKMNEDFWLGIPNLFSIFSSLKKGYKSDKKEILLDNITEIDMDKENFQRLILQYLAENNDRSEKCLTLEFENPAVCLYVLAKLRYLM